MRLTRRIIAGGLLVTLLAPVVLVFGGSGAVSGQQQPAGSGIDTLRTCLAVNRSLDAVLLVDETVSLGRTDPSGARVGALEAVVDAVALAIQGANLQVEQAPITASLLIAGFGMEFTPTPQGWIEVNPSSIPIIKDIAREFRERQDIVGTNYVVALQGAQDSLDQRAAESASQSPACRLVVLFSDGEFEFGVQPPGTRVDFAPDLDLGDPGQRAQAVRVGFDQMCSPNGLLDRIRGTQPATVLIGLGLQLAPEPRPGSELQISPEGLFGAIATGTGTNGVVCGEPNSAGFGSVTTADQVIDLGVGIFCSLNGCAPVPPGALGQPVDVAVDPGVTALVVQAAGTSPFDFRITDPSGTSVSAPSDKAGATTGLATDVIVEPQSDRFSVARISINADVVGDWTIEALVNGVPANDAVAFGVSRQSGLLIESDAKPRLTVGEPASFSAQLKAPDGSAIGTDDLDGTYELSADLRAPGSLESVAGVDARIDPGSGQITLDIDEVPETDLTNLYLEAVLKGEFSDGQQRQPVLFSRNVALLRGGLPLVTAPLGGVRLSGVRGGTDSPTARGSVPVEADGSVVGRACVVGYEQAAPTEGVPAVLDSGDQSCVDLPPGGVVDLPIAVAVAEVQSGEYSGSVLIELTAPNDPLVDSTTVRVPVGFAGYAPLCTGVLVGTIVGILAAAALLVIVILYVLSRLAARFPREDRSTAYASFNVSITGEELTVNSGEPFDLTLKDFAGTLGLQDAGAQSLTIGGSGATVTPQPRWFGMPQAIVRVPGGVVVGCEDGVLQRRRLGRTGRIRHEIAGSWALNIHTATIADTPAGDARGDRATVTATGTLWVMRGALTDGRGLFELTDRVRRGVVGPTVQAVARRMAEQGQKSGGSAGQWLERFRRDSGDAEAFTAPEINPSSDPPRL